ncbi:MAG: hypothetical protein AAB153_04175, partial [Pseudomonadota bacterium]
VGSDYHGPGQSWCDLGQTLPLPEDCTPVWQAWADSREGGGTTSGKKEVERRQAASGSCPCAALVRPCTSEQPPRAAAAPGIPA